MSNAPFICELDYPCKESKKESFEVIASLKWKAFTGMSERCQEHVVYMDSRKVKKSLVSTYLGGKVYSKA